MTEDDLDVFPGSGGEVALSLDHLSLALTPFQTLAAPPADRIVGS